MKGLIQRFPAALLPMLSIKASETPPLLDEVLSPSLDMLAAYVADRMEIQTNSVAGVTAVGNPCIITVPSGEYWYVQNVSLSAANITLGSNVQMALSIADTANVTTYLNAHDAQHVSIAGQQFYLGWDCSLPLLLRPGMKIQGGVAVAPTSLDLILRAFVARLSPQ